MINPRACGFCGFFFTFVDYQSIFQWKYPGGIKWKCCIPKNQIFINECLLKLRQDGSWKNLRNYSVFLFTPFMKIVEIVPATKKLQGQHKTFYLYRKQEIEFRIQDYSKGWDCKKNLKLNGIYETWQFKG